MFGRKGSGDEKEDDNEEIISRLVLDEEQEATIDAKFFPSFFFRFF